MKIQTINDGEAIEAPGFFRMSMDHYHSQAVCAGPSVSSTGIRKAALQSPHAFWKTWDANEHRYPPKEDSRSLILGKAAHSLILGDEVFADHFVFVPDDAPPRPTAAQIAAFMRDGAWSDAAAPRAEFWNAFDAKAKGRHLLTPDQMATLTYMAENLAANPLAMEVLKSDLIEVSMIWQDDRTGLWIKSRPDAIPTNGADFSDLKTFAPRGSNLVLAAHRAITDYAYYAQMALAVMGVEALTGNTAKDCVLVFIQSTEPYEVLPIILDEEALYLGRVVCRHGIDLIARGIATGEWPGAAPDIQTYSIPPSLAERMLQRQADGELPNI